MAKWKLLYVVTLIASLSFAGVNAFDSYNPTVVSDKDDYAPGEVAIISGFGWTQDSLVDIHLEEDPAHDHHHGYHDTKVSPDGTWQIEYPIEDRHLGVKFTVKVEGQQSGTIAYTYFTDANVTFAATGLPTQTSLKVTYQINGGESKSTPDFTPPATPNSVVVPKDDNISYTFPDIIVGGVLYRSTTITTGSNTQTGPTNTYKLPNNGANTITGNYVATCITPTITTQPANQSTIYGAAVSPIFSVDVAGTNPTYQWEYRTSSSSLTWIPITGANAATYAVVDPTVSMNGYQYRVALIGCNTTVYSNPANLTVSPKTLVIGITAESKDYDGNRDAAVAASITSGLVAGDVVTVAASNGQFDDKNVGTGKEVTASVSKSGADAGNYTANTTATASADIRAIALVIGITAESKDYDGNRDAAVAASITSGLVAGDVVTVAASNGQFDDKNVGTGKEVTASVSKSGADAGNYTANTTATASADIRTRAITVAAVTKSKVYGDSDPNLTYNVAVGELVAGENFSGNLKRVAGEDVGVYAIEQNTLTAGTNYTLTYISANLTITQKAITVTADAKEKMFDKTDPALTYTFSPALVGNDSFTGKLIREPGEAVGTYAIEQGTLTAGSNYNLTYVGANLTIHAIPTVVIVNPAPVQYSTKVEVVANYTGIVNNPVWVWGFIDNTDGVKTATSITGSAIVPSVPGVHKLVLQYHNAVGELLTTEPVFISVYDPEGGFITGGGWINSPTGALAGSDAVGKANFGFVAKYKKGKNEVEGNTEFQFQAGGINFKSSAHDAGSLVISGAKATYKGTGTIAGHAGTYNFMVVATDGQVSGGGGNDKFRIKIWNGSNVVYDNARDTDENADLSDLTILGGGSIVIHENKAVAASPGGKKLEAADQLEGLSSARFDNYPNAFSDRTTIRFVFDTEEQFALEVYDVRGSLIKKVATGKAEAGQVYEYELDARNLAEGVYLARLITGSKAQTIKMILKK
ncbi:MBG domain-containing protein [Pontibacter lucknowensis]|nr:MBG domain-containing protein [Pontibacter lucknowensis]